jgi:hypothetical protein
MSACVDAMRAEISWIAAMRGYVRSIVQPMPKPSCAPAWLYVPIPDGSSSEAPVIRPGPRRLRKPFSLSPLLFFFLTTV